MSIITCPADFSIERLPELVRSLALDWSDPFIDQVRLDLSRAKFMPPTGLTALVTTGLLARSAGIELQVIPPANPDTLNYLARMDFFELLGVPVDYQYNRHDGAGRFREIVQVQTERDGDQVVDDLVSILRQQVEVCGICSAINHAFSEVVNNVFHHAQSPTQAIICAQAYPKKGFVELAVVDSGRGIPASLHGNPALSFDSNKEAMDLAISQRVTGRPGKNTGEGLFFTTEFLKENRGEGWIYSQDAAVHIRNGQVLTQGHLPAWPGTIVALRFRTDHPVDIRAIFDRYAPPEKDFDWLF